MKTRAKVIISIIAVVLSIALVTTILLLAYGKSVNQLVRTVEIQRNGLDVKSTMSSFDDIKFSQVGATTSFEGSKDIDLNDFSNIENLAASTEDLKELEKLKNSKVTYKCSYNSDSNNLKLSFNSQFKDGSFEVKDIEGVGFINEQNEIDAVLNIDGEAVLLSYLRNTETLDNNAAGAMWWGFGKFFSFMQKVIGVVNEPRVKLVLVALVAVMAIVAAVVSSVTIAQNVGNTNTNTGGKPTNKPIDNYANMTAALAAGVPMSVSLCEQFYPGSEVTDETEEMTGKKIITGKWTKDKVREMMRDLLKAALAEKVAEELLKEYIYVISYNNAGPTKVQVDKLYTKSEMASGMEYDSWSSLTYKESLAKDVAIDAFKKNYPDGKIEKHENYNIDNIVAMYHFHWIDVDSGHQGGVTGANKKYVVHSFYGEILGVKI